MSLFESYAHSYTDAMNKKTQILLTVICLGLLDAVIPLFPVLGLILIYVILNKPYWFLDTVQEIYDTRSH